MSKLHRSKSVHLTYLERSSKVTSVGDMLRGPSLDKAIWRCLDRAGDYAGSRVANAKCQVTVVPKQLLVRSKL